MFEWICNGMPAASSCFLSLFNLKFIFRRMLAALVFILLCIQPGHGQVTPSFHLGISFIWTKFMVTVFKCC